MLLQPRVTHDYVLFSKIGYGEEGFLGVVSVPKYQLNHLVYGAGFIQGPVNVPHWDWVRKGPRREFVRFNIISIDEHSRSSGI
jgi:hypothetical protein